MKRSVWLRVAIVIIIALLVLLGRGLFYYQGFYRPPVSEKPGYQQIMALPAPPAEFADNYTEGKGIVLVDLAHENSLDSDELNVLTLRLVSRGLTVKFFKERDDLTKELTGKTKAEIAKEKEEVAKKEEGVATNNATGAKKETEPPEPADAFIVICPRKEFSKEDGKIVADFLKDDGKLLLISDPTRFSLINTLSIRFGLIFEPDYLYNQQENEINYQNIFVANFKATGITKKLQKIALYTAGSISSANGGIAFTDNNTYSSVIKTRQELSPLALAQEDKVLAIHDLTFMTEPYNGIKDNNQLIANIADWLKPSGKKKR